MAVRRQREDKIIEQEYETSSSWIAKINVFKLNILDPEIAKKYLPERKTWEYYDMGKSVKIRETSDMTILEWAKISFWRKNQFSMLYLLSARIPNFSLISFWDCANSEMALIVKKEDEIFIEIEGKLSKTQAKESVAFKMIESAGIWDYINTKYKDTLCDNYLQIGDESAFSGANLCLSSILI